MHGYVYAVYVLATVNLAVKEKWHPLRIIGFVLAGTLPIASFVTERRARKYVQNL